MKKENKVVFNLRLFWIFFRIGCFTFGGGWSILAQMEQEFAVKRKWVTKDQLLDMTAVGKSVPGIMITNISMLFGYQLGGVFGGVCAVLGIACPAFLILSLVAVFYDHVKDNFWCHCILVGIQASVVPIIASAAYSLGKDIFKAKKSIIICMSALVIIFITSISNIALIILGILCALGWRKVKNYDLF